MKKIFWVIPAILLIIIIILLAATRKPSGGTNLLSEYDHKSLEDFQTELSSGNSSDDLTAAYSELCSSFYICLPSLTQPYLFVMKKKFNHNFSDFISEEEFSNLSEEYSNKYSKYEDEYPYIVSLKFDSGYFEDSIPELLNEMAGYKASTFRGHMKQAYYFTLIPYYSLGYSNLSDLHMIEDVDFQKVMENVCYDDDREFEISKMDYTARWYLAYKEYCNLTVPEKIYSQLLELAEGKEGEDNPSLRRLILGSLEVVKQE